MKKSRNWIWIVAAIILLIIVLDILLLSRGKKVYRIGQWNIEWYPYHSMENWKSKIKATDKAKLVSIIKNAKLDLISVNEIVDPKDLKLLVESSLSDYDFLYKDGKELMKVGFIYNTKRLLAISSTRWDDVKVGRERNRPAFIAYFKAKDSDFDFYAISLHIKSGPTPEEVEMKKHQWKLIIKHIKELFEKSPDKDLIILGDFNSYALVKNQKGQLVNKIDFSPFMPLVTKYNFCFLTQNLKKGTFCHYIQPGSTRVVSDYKKAEGGYWKPSTIDHILLSPTLCKSAYHNSPVHLQCPLSETTCPNYVETPYYKGVSDHCLIWVELSPN